MKRSESFLVYGVTGILVVILAVAVLFGNEEGRSQAVIEPVDVVELQAEDDSLIELAGEDLVDSEPAPADEEAEGPVEEASEVESMVAEGAALNSRGTSVMALLGEYKKEQHFREDFRVVVVRRGETFDQLVERWCGSLDARREVRALNETLDPQSLHPGTKIRMPWVDDEELIAAFEARQQRRQARATAVPASSSIRTVSATGGRAAGTHVVKPGDSLWKIAAAKVGKGKASAYVDAICELNGISDASRIREGQQLKMPAVD